MGWFSRRGEVVVLTLVLVGSERERIIWRRVRDRHHMIFCWRHSYTRLDPIGEALRITLRNAGLRPDTLRFYCSAHASLQFST